MADIERLGPAERARFFGLIDHGTKLGEARAGQRQRTIVLASIEIDESEKNWRYPHYWDLVPAVYPDRYYPAAANYLAWQVDQSLGRFVTSLEYGQKHAVRIADEAREELGCYDLSDQEIAEVVTRRITFERFAIRIGLHSEND